MFNIRISKRLLATLQASISIGLIVLVFIFSMLPMVSIDTTSEGYGNAGGMLKDNMADSITQYTGEECLPSEIDDSIYVSPIGLLRSLILYGKVIMGNVSYDSELAADINEWLSDDSDRSDITVVAALACTIEKMGRTVKSNESAWTVVFEVIMPIIGIIAVLILTFIFPIVMLLKMIRALIVGAKGRATPEKIAGQLCGSLPGILSLTIIYILMQSISHIFSIGWGLVAIFSAAVVSVLVNAAATRLREYDRATNVYLNTVQGLSILSLVGFCIFFFSIICAGACEAFFGGAFAEYTSSVLSQEISNPAAEIRGEYIFDGIMMICFMLFVVISTAYLDRITKKLSLGGAKKDRNLVLPSFALVASIIPLIISAMEHCYESPVAGESVVGTSFLSNSEYGYGCAVAALVGAFLMLSAEIGIVVLTKLFSKSISAQEKVELLSGKAMRDYMNPELVLQADVDDAKADSDVKDYSCEADAKAEAEDSTNK